MLDIAAEDLTNAGRLDLADSALHAPAADFGGVEFEFYPDQARKTAVLASRLICNHPLPDGNKRVGYLCALVGSVEPTRDFDRAPDFRNWKSILGRATGRQLPVPQTAPKIR